MKHELDVVLLPHEASDYSCIAHYCSKSLSINIDSIRDVRIIRRSIDARKRTVKINLKVLVFIDEDKTPLDILPPLYKDVFNSPQVIVVGAGPAGLFAALRLLELGLKPIVLERGKDVKSRKLDLAQLNRTHDVNPESNYAFGEGGAGTFSDGKLYTRSKKRGNIKRVLETFVIHGADENILVDTHPHIGTDKLPSIISNMRKCIEKHGGEVHFESKVVDLLVNTEKEELEGVCLENDNKYYGPVILATGHSAKDVYYLLHEKKILLEAKSFAMGVRVEHPQQLIDQIQYHNPKGRGLFLPAASYKLVTQIKNRGVYSFCMCPGGIIVPASTKNDEIVVNGMSSSSRGSKWANSGIVVELHPEDLPQEYKSFGLLGGLYFQQYLEETCFKEGGGKQVAPAQALKDFCENKISTEMPSCSYVPGVISSPLHLWLPTIIRERLQEGFWQFNTQMKGYVTNEALIVGVESRTSSPLRIPRNNETLEHSIVNKLYPCGEGAGYAGGIVSSAVDGIRCAEQLHEKYYLLKQQ